MTIKEIEKARMDEALKRNPSDLMAAMQCFADLRRDNWEPAPPVDPDILLGRSMISNLIKSDETKRIAFSKGDFDKGLTMRAFITALHYGRSEVVSALPTDVADRHLDVTFKEGDAAIGMKDTTQLEPIQAKTGQPYKRGPYKTYNGKEPKRVIVHNEKPWEARKPAPLNVATRFGGKPAPGSASLASKVRELAFGPIGREMFVPIQGGYNPGVVSVSLRHNCGPGWAEMRTKRKEGYIVVRKIAEPDINRCR